MMGGKFWALSLFNIEYRGGRRGLTTSRPNPVKMQAHMPSLLRHSLFVFAAVILLAACAGNAHADRILIRTDNGIGGSTVAGGLNNASCTYGSGADTVTLSILSRNNVQSPYNTVDLAFGSGQTATTDFGVINVSFTANGAPPPPQAALA